MAELEAEQYAAMLTAELLTALPTAEEELPEPTVMMAVLLAELL